MELGSNLCEYNLDLDVDDGMTGIVRRVLLFCSRLPLVALVESAPRSKYRVCPACQDGKLRNDRCGVWGNCDLEVALASSSLRRCIAPPSSFSAADVTCG